MTEKPLLNYTTSVDPAKSYAAIEKTLIGHGASEVTVILDKGRRIGVGFVLAISGRGSERYLLPVRPSRVQATLEAQRRKGIVAPRYATIEQAERVAWRIAKDWLEAQLAIVASGQVAFDEVLLPYMVGRNGQTTFDLYLAAKGQLEAPKP